MCKRVELCGVGGAAKVDSNESLLFLVTELSLCVGRCCLSHTLPLTRMGRQVLVKAKHTCLCVYVYKCVPRVCVCLCMHAMCVPRTCVAEIPFTPCTHMALLLLSILDHVAMDETPPSECTIAGGHFAGVGDFPEVAKSPHKSPLHTQDLPFRADPNFSLR